MTATRSRWAALGAATAITLGAGGLGVVGATTGPGEVSTLTNIDPCRLEDTRPGMPGPRNTPLPAATATTFPVHGSNGNCTIPSTATGIVANITAFNATTNTFITAYRADLALPLAALTNMGPGAILSNSVDVDLSPTGAIKIYNEAGTIDVVIDVTGYYSNTNLDARYAQKSDTYTKAQIDAAVGGAGGYTDAQADARIALKTYTKAEVDAMIAAIPVVKGWYPDNDGDGFGQSFIGAVSATQPAGFAANNTDCDDGDADIYPGGVEIPGDNRDGNCDGSEDYAFSDDADGDGWGGGLNEVILPGAFDAIGPPPPAGQGQSGDCDDTNPAIRPYAPDIPGDGIDQNCDGVDGYA
jgi:hypothetical protein